MNKIIFSELAKYYDVSIVKNRFNHKKIANLIFNSTTIQVSNIADLATGTGKMAEALHIKWPKAKIYCEEPSNQMLNILKNKFPLFETKLLSLENTAIKNKNFDLVTIAFNSVNYVLPSSLSRVFRKIREGMHIGAVFYFDAITTDSATALLGGCASLTRSHVCGKIQLVKSLTTTRLTHIFTMPNRKKEFHRQYLIPFKKYISLLENSNFSVNKIINSTDNLRTAFICTSI